MNYNPSEEEAEYISSSLMEFNSCIAGPDNHELLKIVEYDENGKVAGGILGGTYWSWCHIDYLFVDEKYRKTGVGSRLLKAAEEEAKKRGAHAVHLETMSWQAPEFYKKHGYRIIAELNDIPPGYKKFILIKEL